MATNRRINRDVNRWICQLTIAGLLACPVSAPAELSDSERTDVNPVARVRVGFRIVIPAYIKLQVSETEGAGISSTLFSNSGILSITSIDPDGREHSSRFPSDTRYLSRANDQSHTVALP